MATTGIFGAKNFISAGKVGLGVAVFAAALSLGGLSAVAQKAAAPAAAPAPASDPASQWVRLCGTDPATKKEVCHIQRPLFTDSGTTLAIVVLQETKGETLKSLLVQVPTGMLIQPGLQVSLDDKRSDPAKFTLCLPNACFAELQLPADYIPALKKSGVLKLSTLNQQGRRIDFQLGLDGFSAAYDGPPLDTTQAEKKQQELQSELEKKANDAKQKLMDAQKKALQGN